MKQRELILSRMEASVRDYVSERPDADYHTITARFGTPKQIVISCLEEMDGEELARELNVRKKIVGVVIATAFIVTMLWGSIVLSAFAEHDANMDGHIEEKIVEVVVLSNK